MSKNDNDFITSALNILNPNIHNKFDNQNNKVTVEKTSGTRKLLNTTGTNASVGKIFRTARKRDKISLGKQPPGFLL